MSSCTKKSCGHNAFEDWNLTCKIDKNTFKNADAGKDFWADPFRDLQSITICASFDNHGGFGVATIVHNSKDGEQSLPTELFDTVKFRGGLMGEKLSWVGTSPRLIPIWSPAWKMQAELVHDRQQELFAYTEILSNGQRQVGEIRATCRTLEGE